MPETQPVTLDEIRDLAFHCLRRNGADELNAAAVADTLTAAEKDGSHSHGLFRLPAHVASLRSGKVNGNARPTASALTAAVARVHGDNGFAPTAHEVGVPALAEAAKTHGVAVLSLVRVHHMTALWREVEAVAAHGLACMACTAYLPATAPTGATKPFFGTNPFAFAWPRPGKTPVVLDMATAAMAKGEVTLAARAGKPVPLGTGLDADGAPTTDAQKILDGGVLLPFGGHKGAALSLMVELLSAGLLGERFSVEAAAADNKDGGPPRGGEWMLAMSPEVIAGGDWAAHCDSFLERLLALGEDVRLPGERRHKNRQSTAPRDIDSALLAKIRELTDGAA